MKNVASRLEVAARSAGVRLHAEHHEGKIGTGSSFASGC